MNPLQSLINALRRKNDLNEELQSHLRMAAADRVAQGESPERARSEAMRESASHDADVTGNAGAGSWSICWICAMLCARSL